MLKKLLLLYENSILYTENPETSPEHLYVFYHDAENEWIGIPKTEVSEKELTLLKTIYTIVEEQPSISSSSTNGWYDFLLLDGPPPKYPSDSHFRLIQFNLNKNDASQIEMESALKGFFTKEVSIIWESSRRGIVIEEKKQVSLSEDELISMSETLESDFYVKTSFFIGKFHPISEQLRLRFLQEKEYFSFGMSYLGTQDIFAFEHIFPAYLAAHLPIELKNRGIQGISDVFTEDQDLFSTIKVFLESNLNASLTAKKLYIHRNTLQYRIDKFHDKTGIGLKDFYGAFTVFLACLLFEQNQKS
ncbi:helix-turn-helix domain-containing protein [Bacillus sp. 1P10SD]|uniref:PucR family transcriptional regulator n=1 Tax=Bacillus sp. 1P10SD TaxID=3132265 RepID=UPI0039A4D778